MKAKIVLIVLNDFTNDSRVLKEAISLQSLGHAVHVIALHGRDLSEHEVIDGIPVRRVKLVSRPWSKVKLVQLLKYFEFFFRALFYCRHADIVHCNDLNALPIGVAAKILNLGRVKVVYDAHEYEIHRVSPTRRVNIAVNYMLERILIRFADRVMTVSEAIANEYVRLYRIRKPSLVLNCPPFSESKKRDVFRDRFGIRQDQIIVLYQGGLSKGRGIEILLQAFSELLDDKVVFVVMGYGPLESLVLEYQIKDARVFFHPAVSPRELLDYTSSADYGVLFYEDNCLNHRYCSPNKMFEYLMAGIPVLSSNLVEMKRLIEQNNIGVVAESNDAEGFRRALASLQAMDYESLVSRVKTVRRRYCWEEQEKVLVEVYHDL
ncbi:glycosyltransferase involved in cell wall biosynthesis [Hydrogenophaga palleronii]|uniref:Glycosyltransferase involved in cell wall biosynthesis n=1 Tax=Hydrogenophaga palleronii TaxID=65655 RepID=A0ABU1WSR5_9BURK|nr:glycosyltransferase family 4 protein [Hydrogenophaga palleronii]MDR7152337.1 glycosyltransferase involved in cell wall biosynthesis [Hydrogenophaga palleronii]